MKKDLPTNQTNAKKLQRKIFIILGLLIIGVFLFNSIPTTDPPGLLGSWWNNIFTPPKKLKNKNTNTAPVTKPTDSGQNVIYKVVSEESQVIDVVKKSAEAVVSIIASADVPKLEICYKEEPFSDPFFDDFFSFRVPGYCQKGTEKKRVGAGTGFLVGPDGYILTNKHVISNEKAEYTVVLNDMAHKGEKVLAKVSAQDPSNDIAILKIDKNNLPYLQFGDSDRLQVGQTAITIGYALGEFENTVSKGVISGLARSISASGSSFSRPEYLEGVIQTDAAINPGNSGGPLLDISGNVIGMNVAMASAQNIGFAIPSNEIRKVYEDVKKTGKIQRAFLGVRYMPITKEFEEKNNLPYDYGALVTRGEKADELAIVPGSPADIAGIVENDIILEVEGIKVDNGNSLSKIISKYRVGDSIKIKIYHKGQEKEVMVKLTEKK